MKRPTEIDGLVADNVRALRLSRGVTQQGMAAELGLTFQQFQKYEKGVNRISAGQLFQIAKVLEVPVETLYKGVKGPSGKVRSPLRLLGTPDAMKLAQAFELIASRTIRKALVRVVRAIAGLPT